MVSTTNEQPARGHPPTATPTWASTVRSRRPESPLRATLRTPLSPTEDDQRPPVAVAVASGSRGERERVSFPRAFRPRPTRGNVHGAGCGADLAPGPGLCIRTDRVFSVPGYGLGPGPSRRAGRSLVYSGEVCVPARKQMSASPEAPRRSSLPRLAGEVSPGRWLLLQRPDQVFRGRIGPIHAVLVGRSVSPASGAGALADAPARGLGFASRALSLPARGCGSRGRGRCRGISGCASLRECESSDRAGERQRRAEPDRGGVPVAERVGAGVAAGRGEDSREDRDPEHAAELADHVESAGCLADVRGGDGAEDRVLHRGDRHRDTAPAIISGTASSA